MEKLLSILLLILPRKNITINSHLSKQEILVRLENKFIPELIIGNNSFWTSPSRYVGHLISDRFQIDGPYGYKKWTLNTQVQVLTTGQGSKIKINMSLSPVHIFFIILILGFYGIYSIFMLRLIFWHIILFQLLFIYSVILVVFHEEARKLSHLISESLQN